MSDIFISYAREDRALAEALANDLTANGYSVWWDTELVGSDNFQDVILAALAKARAAIVIWSKASIKSLFVRDEARYALHYKKLVAVKLANLDVLDIPFGFQSQHTDDVGDREQIIRAVTKLGVTSAAPSPVPADTWDAVRASTHVDTLLKWLEGNPTHEKRLEAFQRVRALIEAADKAPTTTQETPLPVTRTSYLSAFLSGLTFRMPNFQLSTEGRWSAIGQAIGLVVLLLGGAVVAFVAAATLFPIKANSAYALGIILLSWLALLGAAFRSFAAFVKQRNFGGAWILSPVILMLAVAAPFVTVQSIYADYLDSTAPQPLTVLAVAAGVIPSLIYMVWKVQSVR